MLVDRVGDGHVSKREGVRILPKSRRRVGVTEAGLGLKDPATFDQKGRDVVTQPMKRCSLDA